MWMLTQFYIDSTRDGFEWPVAAAYANGHTAPRHPDTSDGWALVFCNSDSHQIEAAAQDPRVQPYRTVWDTITPETVAAYAAQGAVTGMMLCQLLSLLAQWEAGFMVS
jgi:hypothetical protein